MKTFLFCENEEEKIDIKEIEIKQFSYHFVFFFLFRLNSTEMFPFTIIFFISLSIQCSLFSFLCFLFLNHLLILNNLVRRTILLHTHDMRDSSCFLFSLTSRFRITTLSYSRVHSNSLVVDSISVAFLSAAGSHHAQISSTNVPSVLLVAIACIVR